MAPMLDFLLILDRFRLGRKLVKEKGISKTTMAAVIVIAIVVIAGIGAYFLMKPKEGSGKNGGRLKKDIGDY